LGHFPVLYWRNFISTHAKRCAERFRINQSHFAKCQYDKWRQSCPNREFDAVLVDQNASLWQLTRASIVGAGLVMRKLNPRHVNANRAQ
jgi:hypothetical protein